MILPDDGIKQYVDLFYESDSMKLKYLDSKCSGCRTCQLACSLKNFREVNPAKASLKIVGKFPAPGKFEVLVCNQCGACADVCPTEAIYLENGRYLINNEECIGCMSCVEVCSNGVMMQHRDFTVPFKCNNCGECVSICPRDALVFEEVS